MPSRRPLLAAAFAFAVVRPGWAGSGAWGDVYGELRVGGGGDVARVRAGTGVGAVVVPLRGAALVEALNAGHLEAAVLDPAMAARAVRVMGERVSMVAAGSRVVAVRRALPAGLQADLRAALVDV